MAQKIFLIYAENMAYLRKETLTPKLTEETPSCWRSCLGLFRLGFAIMLCLLFASMFIFVIWTVPAEELGGWGIVFFLFFLLLVGLLFYVFFVAPIIYDITAKRLKNHGRVVKGKIETAEIELDEYGDRYIRIEYTFRAPNTQDVIKNTHSKRNETEPLPEIGTPVAVFYASKKNYKLL
jgi:hypothetical protein